MVKYKRIINGECNFVLTELFNDVEKAADVSNSGEPVECKIDNLRIDFTKVKKDKDEQGNVVGITIKMTPPTANEDKPAATSNKGFQSKPNYGNKPQYKF